MKQQLSILALVCAAITVQSPHAVAQTVAAVTKTEAPKTSAKKTAKKALEKEADVASADEKHPDIAGFSGTYFSCELGNRITVYEAASDADKIKLRWNKQVHDLTRVSTSTGANRFEDKATGLVWIHIPAKAMLLNSKKGQQLANECMSPQQLVAFKAKK